MISGERSPHVALSILSNIGTVEIISKTAMADTGYRYSQSTLCPTDRFVVEQFILAALFSVTRLDTR